MICKCLNVLAFVSAVTLMSQSPSFKGRGEKGKSGEIRGNQGKSGEIRGNQGKSVEIRGNQAETGEIRGVVKIRGKGENGIYLPK
jgi:hypothetical protein